MSEKSSCLIITPQKLVLLMIFEGFSGDISVPLTKATQRWGSVSRKQIISVGKLQRYIKVKSPLTLAMFNDMLINVQALLRHVKAPTGERGLLFQWIICPWNLSVNPNHIKMLHIPMWCTNIHSADLTAHWDTWYDVLCSSTVTVSM